MSSWKCGLKTGLCHILPSRLGGALNRDSSVFCFWSKNFTFDKARRVTVVLHRNIVLKQHTSEQVTFNREKST